MSIPLKIQALHLIYLALIETKLIAKQSRKPTLLASSLLLLAILSSAGRVVRAQTPPPGTSSQAQGAVTSPAPAKTPSPGGAGGAPVDSNTYMIGPSDVLYIRVWIAGECSGPVAVHQDG